MNCSSLYWPSCLSSWVPPWVFRALTVEHTLTVFLKRLLMRISVTIAMLWWHCKSFCCDMVILLVLASKSTALTWSYFRTGLSIFCLVWKSAPKVSWQQLRRCSQDHVTGATTCCGRWSFRGVACPHPYRYIGDPKKDTRVKNNSWAEALQSGVPKSSAQGLQMNWGFCPTRTKCCLHLGSHIPWRK